MRKLLPFCIFLASCASGGTVMTMGSFHEVPIGASTNEVITCVGKPYAIHCNDDGSLDYEYIERIKIGARDAEERRYLITIKNGVVVSKRVKQSSPLPYSFDSYDMQTTQNSDHSNE